MGAIIQGAPPAEFNAGSGSGYGDGSGSGSGSGYGYGSGSGDGYGYGSGSGDGYGDGYGYGDGSGYGDGYGDGYGYGDGSGYGSGYGYGDGDGYGDGYGYGSKEYWLGCVKYFATKWPAEQQSRLQKLQRGGATIAYWRSNTDGCTCNGGRNDPVKPGTIETSKGPLSLCSRGTLHATLIPPKWEGKRWWIVALTGEIVGDEEKYGALSREIIGEAL